MPKHVRNRGRPKVKKQKRFSKKEKTKTKINKRLRMKHYARSIRMKEKYNKVKLENKSLTLCGSILQSNVNKIGFNPNSMQTNDYFDEREKLKSLTNTQRNKLFVLAMNNVVEGNASITKLSQIMRYSCETFVNHMCSLQIPSESSFVRWFEYKVPLINIIILSLMFIVRGM